MQSNNHSDSLELDGGSGSDPTRHRVTRTRRFLSSGFSLRRSRSGRHLVTPEPVNHQRLRAAIVSMISPASSRPRFGGVFS
jgi:hypothetical protein